MLYAFPDECKVGKVVPKSDIYRYGSLDSALWERFDKRVERVVWSYKLSKETLYIASTDKTPEIEVFDIYLTDGKRMENSLLCIIDRAVALPIIFYIHDKKGRIECKAAYKNRSKRDGYRMVVRKYFGGYIQPDTPQKALPQARNLHSLWLAVLKDMIPAASTQKRTKAHSEIEAL